MPDTRKASVVAKCGVNSNVMRDCSPVPFTSDARFWLGSSGADSVHLHMSSSALATELDWQESMMTNLHVWACIVFYDELHCRF